MNSPRQRNARWMCTIGTLGCLVGWMACSRGEASRPHVPARTLTIPPPSTPLSDGTFGQMARMNVSGWGKRGAFVFGGEVSIAPSGDVAGQFTIVIDEPNGTHGSCRYHRFWSGSASGASAVFSGLGYCHGPNGWYYSTNRFAITNVGSPGAGVDTIDVNLLSAIGVAIPGGTLDSGDLYVGP